MTIFSLFSGKTRLSSFRSNEEGAILVEALVIIPVMFIFAAGILEMGNIFWQRQQVETGLRDYARYIARCPDARSAADCANIAENLAFYGNVDGSGALRVIGWDPDNGSTITVTRPVITGSDIDPYEVVSARTTHNVVGGPLFQVLGVANLSFGEAHNQRIIGR